MDRYDTQASKRRWLPYAGMSSRMSCRTRCFSCRRGCRLGSLRTSQCLMIRTRSAVSMGSDARDRVLAALSLAHHIVSDRYLSLLKQDGGDHSGSTTGAGPRSHAWKAMHARRLKAVCCVRSACAKEQSRKVRRSSCAPQASSSASMTEGGKSLLPETQATLQRALTAISILSLKQEGTPSHRTGNVPACQKGLCNDRKCLIGNGCRMQRL